MGVYLWKIGLIINFDWVKSIDIVVIEQKAEAELHGCSFVPGLIAIAGHAEPEIERRILELSVKSAWNGWRDILLSKLFWGI